MRNPCRLPPATIVGYLVAFVVALGFYAASVPLAWILGPLLVSAALSLSGFDIRPPVTLRRLGQLAIGVTVGLGMTAAVLLQVVDWLPVMIVTAVSMVLVSAVFSVLLARFAHLDLKSAFFANLPGGLAEMGNVGERMGAHPEPIAIVQSLRVALIVVAVPPLFIMLGFGSPVGPAALPDIPAAWVLVLLIVGSAGALLLHVVRLNNPWMIGALVSTAGMVSNGLVSGRMPPPVFFAAQLFIGYAVGSRFRPSMIRRLPRVTAVGALTILGIGTVMVGYAGLLSGLSDLDFITAVLATSPGGMAEMAATAQTLHLSVALVVAFQVVRAVMVNSMATVYWTLLSKSGFLALVERVVGRPPAVDPDDRI